MDVGPERPCLNRRTFLRGTVTIGGAALAGGVLAACGRSTPPTGVEPAVHTMGGTEALQWMVDLIYTQKVADPASLESTEDDVRKALQTDAYALTYNWEGVLPEANDPTKSRAAPPIRVALLPGGKGVKSASVNGSEGWGILAHSNRKEVVWRLIEYMASPAWQKRATIVTGNYPIMSSLYDDPELQQMIQDFPVYGEQLQYLVTRPQLVSYAQASDILQKYLHKALFQQLNPKEAMDAAVDEVHKASIAP